MSLLEHVQFLRGMFGFVETREMFRSFVWVKPANGFQPAFCGNSVSTSKSMYSSDSQLLLSRPSVSGAYLKVHKKNNYSGISSTVSSTYKLFF